MKRMKRLIAIAVSLVVLTASAAACGKNTADTAKPTEAPAKQGESVSDSAAKDAPSSEPVGVSLPLSDEKVTLTMYAGSMDGNFSAVSNDYNENAFFQELEKRTNVHIEFQTVPQGSADAFNLMIASGDLPDLIYGPGAYQDGLDAGIDDGYYLDLTPYLDTHLTNYNKRRSQSEDTLRDTATDSGRIAAVFQIYQTPQPPWMGLMIRKDWLDELELKVPRTASEWETVLTAFKEKKEAYAPMSLGGVLGLYGQGFGVATGTGIFFGSYLNVDGKAVYGDTTDNMKAFITVLADWYKKGLIDPDFMTKQSAYFGDTAMVTTGQTGVFNSMYTMPDMYKATSDDPDFELVAIKNPIPDSGDEGRVGLGTSRIGSSLAISADSKNKEIAMKWLDYLFTEEGSLLANYGIEGDTFSYNEEGKPVYTEKITKNTEGLAMAHAMAFYTLPPSMLPSSYDWTRELAGVSKSSVDMMYAWDEQKVDYNYPAQATMTSEENREYATLFSNIQTYSSEVITQFITGVKDIDAEWDGFVKTINELGIDRCLELRQAALDRYLQR